MSLSFKHLPVALLQGRSGGGVWDYGVRKNGRLAKAAITTSHGINFSAKSAHKITAAHLGDVPLYLHHKLW